jgi:hypothetical protein
VGLADRFWQARVSTVSLGMFWRSIAQNSDDAIQFYRTNCLRSSCGDGVVDGEPPLNPIVPEMCNPSTAVVRIHVARQYVDLTVVIMLCVETEDPELAHAMAVNDCVYLQCGDEKYSPVVQIGIMRESGVGKISFAMADGKVAQWRSNRSSFITFYMQPGEYITAIGGRKGSRLDAIKFTLSTRRTCSSPQYGGRGGSSFVVSAPHAKHASIGVHRHFGTRGYISLVEIANCR